MRDVLHRALTWVDHYRYSMAALVVTALLVGGAALSGCSPLMVTSPVDGSRQVSEDQLAQEYATLQEMVKAKVAEAERAHADAVAFAEAAQIRLDASQSELERKVRRRQEVWTAVSQTATSLAAVAPPPVGTIVAGLLGLGAILLNVGQAADGRRKDRLILELKGEPQK